MTRLRALALVLTLIAGAFALPASHAAANCDAFDTRLCDNGKAPDGTTTAAGGVDKVSYADDRCRLGGCAGFGIGGGGGSGSNVAEGTGQAPTNQNNTGH